MKHALSIILVLGVSISAHVGAAQEKPLKVFVLAGQSNMVGAQGNASQLSKELQGEQIEAVFFDGKQWVPVAPGRTETRGFGPEISFAYRMREELKEPVGIIKHSIGGTSLALDWSPANHDSLYVQLLSKVSAARQQRAIEIIAMLWMQGERDSRDQGMAEAYAKNLASFISAARKDFRAPSMFFVAGRVNPPRPQYPFVDIVRSAQEECKEARYAFVDCDSLEKLPDGLHYSTRGLVDMGYRFAEAILRLMKSE